MQLFIEYYSLAFPQQLATSQISKVKRQGWRIYLIHHDQVLGIGESAPWVGFGAGEKEVKEELGHIRQDQQLLEIISTLVEKSKLESLVFELGQKKAIKDRLVILKSYLDPVLELINTPEVRFALELCLLDYLAQYLNLSLSSLFNPSSLLQASTHCLVNTCSEAIEMAQKGFKAVKIKVGKTSHWVDELIEISKIHATLPHLEIRVDANQAWSAELALGFCVAAQAFGVAWVEEPCSSFAEWQKLKQALGSTKHASLGIDESLSQTAFDTQHWLNDSFVDVITIKPMFLGGLIPAALLAIEAQEQGTQVCITHSLGSWVERIATTHLVAALSPHISSLAAGLGGGLENDLWEEPKVRGGKIYLPSSSGIGSQSVQLMAHIKSLKNDQRSFSENSEQEQFLNVPVKGVTRSNSQTILPHPLKQSYLARPQHIALQQEDRQLTYSDLAQQASFLAMTFEKLFTSSDPRAEKQTIALSGQLSPLWCSTFYALLGDRYHVAPIKAKWTAQEQESAFSQLKVHYLIHVADELLHIYQINVSKQKNKLVSSSLTDLGFIPTQQYDIKILSTWSWNHQLVKIYTSGTTGQPQVVALMTSQICLSAFGSNIRLGHHLDDCWLACLPPYHVGGISTLLRCLFNQTSVYICEPQKRKLMIAIQKASIISLTPTLLSELLDELDDLNQIHTVSDLSMSFNQLRIILVGGGPTSQSLWQRAQKYKLPLRITWGMSEAASQLCTQVELEQANMPLPPMPFAEIEHDQEQRLWIKGPLVVDGELCSSDLGEVSKQGVQVYGRADDTILSGGINISSLEVEEVLCTHQAIKEVAVFGIYDEKYGQRPIAYLVQNDTARRPSHQELTQWCKQSLSSYKVPNAFIWIETIPKTALGKVQKYLLRTEYQKQANNLSFPSSTTGIADTFNNRSEKAVNDE